MATQLITAAPADLLASFPASPARRFLLQEGTVIALRQSHFAIAPDVTLFPPNISWHRPNFTLRICSLDAVATARHVPAVHMRAVAVLWGLYGLDLSASAYVRPHRDRPAYSGGPMQCCGRRGKVSSADVQVQYSTKQRSTRGDPTNANGEAYKPPCHAFETPSHRRTRADPGRLRLELDLNL